jgi:hypothetical protein
LSGKVSPRVDRSERSPQSRLEVRESLLDGPGLRAHGTGNPVDGAKLVDDGALDARNGIRLETQVAVRLESLDGVDQPDDSVADQVLLIEVARQA